MVKIVAVEQICWCKMYTCNCKSVSASAKAYFAATIFLFQFKNWQAWGSSGGDKINFEVIIQTPPPPPPPQEPPLIFAATIMQLQNNRLEAAFDTVTSVSPFHNCKFATQFAASKTEGSFCRSKADYITAMSILTELWKWAFCNCNLGFVPASANGRGNPCWSHDVLGTVLPFFAFCNMSYDLLPKYVSTSLLLRIQFFFLCLL